MLRSYREAGNSRLPGREADMMNQLTDDCRQKKDQAIRLDEDEQKELIDKKKDKSQGRHRE